MPLSRINSASIANSAISAADIADGTITAAKIISVANTQITGNIVSSQITSVGGSQITANTIANSAFQTGSVESYMRAVNLDFGLRNRIINGAMVIAQRGTSSADPASNQYVIDRWVTGLNVTGKISIAQSSEAPAGFTNSFLVTSSSAYTVQPSDIIYLQQRIEGFNTADLSFGTASAKSLAMSFWVRSSLTGTFTGFLQNADETRVYAFTYTIAAANTWQQVIISIPGDTSGTWIGASNNIGMRVSFSLCAGSSYLTTANSWNSATAFGVTGQTNLVATNGATFYVTGVQLEVGSTATSFDYRPYTTELQLCQRYYAQSVQNVAANALYNQSYGVYLVGWNYNGGSWVGGHTKLPVTMRTAPSCTIYTTNAGGAQSATANRCNHYQGTWVAAPCLSIATLTNENSLAMEGSSGTGSTGSNLLQFNYIASAEL
jgi:hypothetical protein